MSPVMPIMLLKHNVSRPTAHPLLLYILCDIIHEVLNTCEHVYIFCNIVVIAERLSARLMIAH